uniref:Transmembrane protein 126A n=1 Tax=Urocitellus parryii TaxID=9999 RepID=A0A8D2KD42_UROPR
MDCWEESNRVKIENYKSHDSIKGNLIFDIINRKIEQLPEAKRNLLEHESTYIGLKAAVCGLIENSLFPHVVHVTQAPTAAGLPMAVSSLNFIVIPIPTTSKRIW